MNVDVIVPTYYAKKDILKRTVSDNCRMLKLSNFNFRYIIVVDYFFKIDNKMDYDLMVSSDSNVDIYFKYNTSLLKEQHRCINFGFSIGSSNNVLIMDDDYLLTCDFLNSLKNEVEKRNEDYDGIFLPSYFEENEKMHGGLGQLYKISKDPNIEGMTIGSGSPKLINRKTANKIGLYNNDFIGYMFCDNEFTFRYANRDIIILPENFGVRCIKHKYYHFGNEIEKNNIHNLTYSRNKEIFNRCSI